MPWDGEVRGGCRACAARTRRSSAWEFANALAKRLVCLFGLRQKRYEPAHAPAHAIEQLYDEIACVGQIIEHVMSRGGERCLIPFTLDQITKPC